MSDTKKRLEAHFTSSSYNWEIFPLQVDTPDWDDLHKRELILCQQARFGRFHVSNEPTAENTELVWFARRRKKK